MLLRTLEAPVLGATCTLIVDDEDRVVVVDAGGGVADRVLALVASRGWTPVAVLATHGHVDHWWDAGALCAAWSVALHVHQDDAYRLADPFGTLGPLGAQLAASSGVPLPVTPGHVVALPIPALTSSPLEIDFGLPIQAGSLPGHTEGSTSYLVSIDAEATLLTGDVLFAGSVGRTDLPGGDPRTMAASLTHLAGYDASTQVIPGHGPRTTIGQERRTNPYLRAAL